MKYPKVFVFLLVFCLISFFWASEAYAARKSYYCVGKNGKKKKITCPKNAASDLCRQMKKAKKHTKSLKCSDVKASGGEAKGTYAKTGDDVETGSSGSGDASSGGGSGTSSGGSFGQADNQVDFGEMGDDQQKLIMSLMQMMGLHNGRTSGLDFINHYAISDNFAGAFTPASLALGVRGFGSTISDMIANVAETTRFSTAGVPGTNHGRLACAWALNHVVKLATGRPILSVAQGGRGTASVVRELQRNTARYMPVDPRMVHRGNVCVAGTTYDGGGNVGHRGHAYVVGSNGRVCQNSSKLRGWTCNATMAYPMRRHGNHLKCFQVLS